MIKKIRSLNLDRIITIYILLTLLHAFISRILPLYLCIGHKADSLIFIVFAIAGCVLMFLDFVGRRIMFKGQDCVFLFLFIGVLILSSLINIKYGIIDNIKTISWTAIHVCIFYAFFSRMGKREVEKTIYLGFNLISWIWTIAVAYSLKQYVLVECYGVEIAPEVWRNQGFRNNRLYGVFNDPNFAAVTSAYVILMLTYIFVKCKKKWMKVLCIFSLVLQLFYIILSGSRTALVCIGSVIILWLFLILKGMFKEYSRWKRWLSRVGVFAISIGIIIIAKAGITKGLSTIPETYMKYHVLRTEKELTPEEELKNYNIQNMTEEGMLDRDDVQTSNISNNRFAIWKAYIKGLKGRYIIGASPRNIQAYLEDNDKEEYLALRNYETHSGFISVFAGSGIVGLIVILIFLIRMAKKVLIVLYKTAECDIGFWVISSILLIIVIYTCFFTELFFVNNLTTVIFWTLLGSLKHWTGKEGNFSS